MHREKSSARVSSYSKQHVNKREAASPAGTAWAVLFLHFGKEEHGATGKAVPEDEAHPPAGNRGKSHNMPGALAFVPLRSERKHKDRGQVVEPRWRKPLVPTRHLTTSIPLGQTGRVLKIALVLECPSSHPFRGSHRLRVEQARAVVASFHGGRRQQRVPRHEGATNCSQRMQRIASTGSILFSTRLHCLPVVVVQERRCC